MDRQRCSVDLSGAPFDVITALMGYMDLEQRCTCALVCRAWAEAAAEATHTIIKSDMRDLTQLQQWLDKHGSQVETLKLLKCSCSLARLPCARLQDLLLHGVLNVMSRDDKLILGSKVWSDIAAATKLTYLSLEEVSTTCQQADVVSALAALPDLQQLTWRGVKCGQQHELSDSRLLQHLTRITSSELQTVALEALQHLSLLTKLRHLRTHSVFDDAAADYPELQELQGLTSLVIHWQRYIPEYVASPELPTSVGHLTALQQLELSTATATELNFLTALAALKKLVVADFSPSSQHSPRTLLRLPALEHLCLGGNWGCPTLHTSYLASCTQLRFLWLGSFCLTGPGSLVASKMLQELDLRDCSFRSGEDGPAAMSRWELVFPGPGRLPHLTSLVLQLAYPDPRQADVEQLVAICSGLQSLQLVFPPWGIEEFIKVLPLLPPPHLTQLEVNALTDQQCSSLAQLTGLRELFVFYPVDLSAAGLRHLARLEQLTSLKFRCEFDSRKVSTVLQEQLSDTVLGCRHAIVNQAPAGDAPDVSARLLRACDMAAGGQQQH